MRLASVQTVVAVQARLQLDAPGRVRVDVRFNDTTGNPLLTTTLYDGDAVDGQAIGVALGSPLPGVRDVYLIFTQSPTGIAPGLRTVGVYAQ